MTRIIGIAGGTASGKSTLAEALARRTGALLVAQDRFYRSLPEGVAALAWNFDEPAAVDLDGLATALAALACGGTAELPAYAFQHHRRAPGTERVGPATLVVVEGLFVLRPPIRALLHRAVYVHAPDDLRLIRRIRRDIAERGRTVDEVLVQYERTVRPAHERYVAPSAASADLRVDGMGALEDALEALVGLR